MKAIILGMIVLLCGLLVNASPLDSAKKDSKKVEIKPESISDNDDDKEILNTSSNYGIGYYPVMYDGYYGINRPEYTAYSSDYGSYGSQWSQYSRYNNYRGYRTNDGYYGRPVYTVWG